uniref:Uncharacterized protein n=1 Tax=Salix viminalis TaxID=40686 RepID=A0A6N2L5B5_SALVM
MDPIKLFGMTNRCREACETCCRSARQRDTPFPLANSQNDNLSYTLLSAERSVDITGYLGPRAEMVAIRPVKSSAWESACIRYSPASKITRGAMVVREVNRFEEENFEERQAMVLCFDGRERTLVVVRLHGQATNQGMPSHLSHMWAFNLVVFFLHRFDDVQYIRCESS